MGDIQVARYGRLVQGLLDLKQRLTLGTVLPDVMPTLDIERRLPESEILAGTDLCAAFTGVAAVAGEFGNVTLTLPANSGRIAIIEQIAFHTTANTPYRIAIGSGTPAGATGAFSQFLDTRRRLTRATAVVRTSSSVGSLTTNGIFSSVALANTFQSFQRPIVLANNPGLAGGGPVFVMLECVTVNTAFQASFYWRERDLGAQENFL